jgi:hypothetical protein
MYLWMVKRIEKRYLTEAQVFVIAADTSPDAREIAAHAALACGEKDSALWRDADYASVTHIGEAEPSTVPEPGVILADFTLD